MSATAYDVDKLDRLRIDAEVAEAQAGTLSRLVGDAREEMNAHRRDINGRSRWAADEPRRRLSFAEMLDLGADELQAAGLDMLSVRRAAAAEQRLAALVAQQTEHAQRTAALRQLVRRLDAWAGAPVGGAVGLATPSLGVAINRGVPA